MIAAVAFVAVAAFGWWIAYKAGYHDGKIDGRFEGYRRALDRAKQKIPTRRVS